MQLPDGSHTCGRWSAALTLAILLLFPGPAAAEDGADTLARLQGLISTADLPLGFQEARKHASPRYPDASIRYEGADGEVVTALASIMPADDLRSWLQESIVALRGPRHGLRMLGMGDGAYTHRTSNITKAFVVSERWRLSVRVEGGARPAAEANRLAEQLIRKMFARFSGERDPVPDQGEIRTINHKPVISRVSFSPSDPTFEDELTLTVSWKDPDGDAMTVRWWYPSGSTLQNQEFTLPAGATSHAFTMPVKPAAERIEIQVFVLDGRDGKASSTRTISVEAPAAQITSTSGIIGITRRIGRLQSVETANLYRGDKVLFVGTSATGFIKSSATFEWPKSGTTGQIRYDGARMSQDSTSEYITIGATRRATGFPGTVDDVLFEWMGSQAQSKGVEMILVRPLVTAVNAVGWFEVGMGTGGSSGLVKVNLKSKVVIRGQEDGSLAFYTLEGAPELTSASGRAIVVQSGHSTRIGAGATVSAPVRFDTAELGDVDFEGIEQSSTKATTGSARGRASVQSVQVETGVTRSEGLGLLIKTGLRVHARKGVPTEVYAFFTDREGKLLSNLDKSYGNTQGYVCVFDSALPAYEDAQWKAHELFIPYRQLHLSPGRHQLQVKIEVYDPATGTDLAVSEKQRFDCTIDDSLGHAFLSDISVQYDMVFDGVKGMLVHYALDTIGRVGRGTHVVMHVEFQNGEKLRDNDGSHRDSEGYVATFQEHMPAHPGSHWNDSRLFMPYSQLHLADGEHQLRFLLRVSDPPTNTSLARSNWIEFKVKM